LELRGYTILENVPVSNFKDALLGTTLVAVLNHTVSDASQMPAIFGRLSLLIDHGIRVLVLEADRDHLKIVKETFLQSISAAYPWDQAIRFASDLKGVNFDNILGYQPAPKWSGRPIKQIGRSEPLTDEELRLVDRAFPKAQEVNLQQISSGFSGSKVYMAYEKRSEVESSVAHWTQPRLIKIGDRSVLSMEVGAMRAVSPYVPFELRPNLEIYIEGFRKAVYIADFVDKSESMLDAARAGRAEAAISNLFNRTLRRWRDRAGRCDMSTEPLTHAAVRLGMIEPAEICDEYLESDSIQRQGIDPTTLWGILDKFRFEHRVATIHGDLHGDNVRVRGDDAILIDLGAVKGDTETGMGAPLCFDVAMLEVALLFTYRGLQDGDNSFHQPAWREQIEPFYELGAILSSPSVDVAPRPDDWVTGCIQRIRAFGIYEQSHRYEYAIALAVALWRWCKFRSAGDADKGRRVVALELGAHIINQIEEKERG
jgi:hypothetical protein